LEKRINLVLVSYLNTLPFLNGFGQVKDHPFDITLAPPSECARLFHQHKCDIALLPVGALLHAENYSLITDYCIGCDGAVRTVCLMSQKPIEEINEVFLDGDSKTSALLVQVLCKEYFKRKMKFIDTLPENMSALKANQAILAIGDKVFEYEKIFGFKYDLGAAWKDLTSLPFAFAVFVSRDHITSEVSGQLNMILKKGIENIAHLDLEAYRHIPDIEAYFTNHISYRFDQYKWKAWKIYMEKCREL
jgi:chorismate dehydratase